MQVAFRSFDELSPHELYGLLRLRTEVFVVEQNCVFQDMDDLDQGATHALGRRDGELVAYARFYLADGELHLGRIVTAPSVRGQGHGRGIVRACLTRIGPATVVMSAQAHLAAFYGSLGFRPEGEGYLEDGIPHVRMVRSAG